ncbi:MAG TPA: DUF559 domain-containing protein [Phycisphaerae bacterium]|nr:DUF559 domain-containing protein [Phycisphaerae bacterium]
MAKTPKRDLEGEFGQLWNLVGPTASPTGSPAPTRQHRFAPPRRWRFDFAWPAQKVAVEIEGGTFVRGRHTRGAGFQGDCEKYNAAVSLGWRVLRYTSVDLDRRPAQMIEEILAILSKN